VNALTYSNTFLMNNETLKVGPGDVITSKLAFAPNALVSRAAGLRYGIY